MSAGRTSLSRYFSRGSVWHFVVALLVFGGLGTAWAVANPLGQVPDEPAHVIKAYGVAHGQPFGTAQPGPNGYSEYVFDIPEVYSDFDELVCNWGQTEKQARECSIQTEEPEGSIVQRSSPAGANNPTYYYLVGWPSLIWSGLPAVTVMRIVSAWLSAIFLAATVWLLSLLPRRRLPVMVAIFAVTPGVLFYSASVNPQGAEVAILSTFTVGIAVALQTQIRGRWLWGVMSLVVLAGALGAQVRNLAWIWLGMIVITLFAFAGPAKFWRFLRRPAVLAGVAGVFVGIGVNLGILLHFSAFDGAPGPWGAGWSKVNGFLTMLWRGPEFAASMFGTFGWVDTESYWSTFIYGAFTIALVMTVFLVRSIPRGQMLAVWISIGALWVLPALIQAMSITQGGFIWQGRYSLPLWTLMLYVSAMALASPFEERSKALQSRIVWLLAGSLFVAQFAAFTAMMQRQYDGIRSPLVALLTGWRFPEKYGQAPVLGTAGWMIVALALCVALALFLNAAGRPVSVADRRENGRSGRHAKQAETALEPSAEEMR